MLYSYDTEQGLYIPLELLSMEVDASCHIGAAFVTVEARWQVPEKARGKKSSPHSVLAMPMEEGTVTDVEVWKKDGVYTTAIVPEEDAKGKAKAAGGSSQGPRLAEHPELFTLALTNAAKEKYLSLRLTYFSHLHFFKGRYLLRVPLTVPESALNGRRYADVVTVRCLMNPGGGMEVNLRDVSHPIGFLAGRQTATSVRFKTDPGEFPMPNADFTASYEVWSDSITSAALVRPPEESPRKDGLGTFALSVSPPSPDAMQSFVRSVVFCIDTSGSMSGKPMESANKALKQALQNLGAADEFEIVAFNHNQVAFSGQGLLNASNKNIQDAFQWVDASCIAGGLTNIMDPMCMAFDALANAQGVPYIFLITDGAVRNEREICYEAQRRVPSDASAGSKNPRVNTFGIGRLCNHYFLKQLSSIGRGLYDAAFSQDRIETRMERMMEASSRPVLTEVALGIESTSVTDVAMYPFPIPDLYSGQPLLLSATFRGTLPQAITIAGNLPDGQRWEQEVPVYYASGVPLEKVFAKQQIDLLSAKAWLLEGFDSASAKATREQVQQLSIREGMPSPHTTVVAFETSKGRYENDIKRKKESGNGVGMGTVTAVAAGGALGVVALGVLSGGFGDMGATASNLASMTAEGVSGGFDVLAGSMGACWEACASCGGAVLVPCGETCAGWGASAFSVIGSGCGTCFSGIADGCQTYGGVIGPMFETCANGCTGAASSVWECCSSIDIGSIANSCGSCFEVVFAQLGTCFSSVMNVVNDIL